VDPLTSALYGLLYNSALQLIFLLTTEVRDLNAALFCYLVKDNN